ncbi:MAG: hypothetical protein ACPF9L_03750 [Candidatus Poseidoniaceae archaeon]
MRRWLVVVLVALMLPTIPGSADQDPFNFYIEDEIVAHPGETVQLRIAWQNIVGTARHFSVSVNSTGVNLTVSDLPTDWTRVASGRLGEMLINVTVAPDSNFETQSFSLDFLCQEVENWSLTHNVDVLISKWSNIRFGSNDGSEFYVLQDVRTGFAINVSNQADYNDTVKLRFNTQTNWEYGFDDDLNNDGELLIDLQSGDYEFINFYIQTPPIVNGGPLAGTGPQFSLEAVSNLDRRVSSWNFSLRMETYHNMTIDVVEDNLTIEPGDNERLEVIVRNNGNTATYLDAGLLYGDSREDRFEIDNWTVAIFNAFEFQPLEPNESRAIEIGFNAPNINLGSVDLELDIMPQSFPQRSTSVEISSSIDWQKNGSLSKIGDSCAEVEWNQTCQQLIQIENTGNFFQDYKLEILDYSGMNFEITQETIGLSRSQNSIEIPLNITPFENAEAFTTGSAELVLRLTDGTLVDSLDISSKTAPRVFWVWEDSATSVSNGRLEMAITMRNDGNTADGLVVRMTSSYFTEMSFIPPNNAIVEDGSKNIRSFEIIDIDKGANFTFRAWAKIPDNQNSADDFYINITAHSRLADDKPFRFTANTSFDAAISNNDNQEGIVDSIGDIVSTIFAVIWAWKWIAIATVASGLMINKSIRDRRARLADMELMNSQQNGEQKPDDWMAEFATKKQPTPEIAQSPQIPSAVFTGMFQAVGGGQKPVAEPVDSRLVGAASTVLDHHDTVATKSKLDDLVENLATGNVSTPHMANVALPNNIIPVTERTVPKPKANVSVPTMLDLDDLDL